MAVTLPTSDDVRKAREQAAKAAATQAQAARTPFLAVLGASDYAVSSVTRAVDEARTRAAAQRAAAQKLLAAMPDEPRGWFSPEQLRKVADAYRAQAEEAYAELIERGEKAWDRFRHQPQVEQAVTALESYTEKLDARVDEIVDASHDAAEKALATVSAQTRANGELFARATQRFSRRAAGTVAEAAQSAGETVAEAGAEAADEIRETGSEVAAETRSTTRRAANRTAPKAGAKAAAKTGTRRTATRRTASAKVQQPES